MDVVALGCARSPTQKLSDVAGVGKHLGWELPLINKWWYFGGLFWESILPSPSQWIACNVRIFRLVFSKHRTGSMNFIQFLHSSTTAFITMCLGCMESQLCFSIWDSILLSGSSAPKIRKTGMGWILLELILMCCSWKFKGLNPPNAMFLPVNSRPYPGSS